MNTDELRKKLGLSDRIARFSEHELPDALADARRLGRVVMHGDHDGEEGEYWVVATEDVAVLERAGYERFKSGAAT